MWVRFIVYSIKPKFGDWFFVDFRVLHKWPTRNWSVSSANQNRNKKIDCTNTRKSTKNRSSNFGLMGEIIDLSHILNEKPLFVMSKQNPLCILQSFLAGCVSSEREAWLVLYWLCTSKSWCRCIYFVSSFAISPELLLLCKGVKILANSYLKILTVHANMDASGNSL